MIDFPGKSVEGDWISNQEVNNFWILQMFLKPDDISNKGIKKDLNIYGNVRRSIPIP